MSVSETTAAPDRVGCPTCSGTGYIISDEARGADVRAQRLAADLTITAVAKRVGISLAYLSDLERGKRKWTPKLLAAVTDAIGEGAGA